MVFLGVDPGSYTSGYAFLDKGADDSIRVLEYGAISAKSRDSFADRLPKSRVLLCGLHFRQVR